MTDNELLQAIGSIIDEKLDKKLQPITENIAEIKADISDMKEQLHDVNDAIGLITDWIEKASDLNRIPFLEAK